MPLNATVFLETNNFETHYNLDFDGDLGSPFLVPANSTYLFSFSIDYSYGFIFDIYNISVFVVLTRYNTNLRIISQENILIYANHNGVYLG